MIRTLVIALATLASAASDGSESPAPAPAAPAGSSVHIVSVKPGLATALHTGDKTDVTIEAEYTFTGDSGTLGLVVQAADGSLLANDTDVVLKGSGKVTLSASFTVPTTKIIQVFCPLAAQGQAGTSTVDSRAFKVLAR